MTRIASDPDEPEDHKLSESAPSDVPPHAATSNLADSLDQEQIEQLHAVTLQVSGNCFELKKLCATVLGAAVTIIVTLAGNEVTGSIFYVVLSLVVTFWIADVQSYYIQAKLRRRMREIQAHRVRRGGIDYEANGVGLPVPQARTRQAELATAFFNSSMLFYFLAAALLTIAWFFYLSGSME